MKCLTFSIISGSISMVLSLICTDRPGLTCFFKGNEIRRGIWHPKLLIPNLISDIRLRSDLRFVLSEFTGTDVWGQSLQAGVQEKRIERQYLDISCWIHPLFHTLCQYSKLLLLPFKLVIRFQTHKQTWIKHCILFTLLSLLVLYFIFCWANLP